jgi:hypothetical protein
MEYSALRRAGRTAGLVVTTAAILASYACRMHRNDSVSPVDTSVITENEIDSAHAFNAYDAVYRLRPRFLTSRGKLSLDPTVAPALPNVYVDDMFYGDVTTLRGIAAGSIESIRFYDPASAQYKFGHGNMAGVIGITTKH